MYYVGNMPVYEYDIKHFAVNPYSTKELAYMCYLGMPQYTPYDIAHFGIKGMHWGIRRYQNSDGTLTRAGIDRYREYRDGSNKGGFGRRLATNLIGRSIDAGSRGSSLLRKAGAMKRAFGEQRAADKLRKGIMDTFNNMREGKYDSVDVAKRHTQWRDEKEAHGAGIFGSGLDVFVKNFSKMTTAEINEAFDVEARDRKFKKLLKEIGNVGVRNSEMSRMRSTVDRGRSFITNLFDSEVRTGLHQTKMTVDRNDRQWDDPKLHRYRMGYAW